MSPVCLAWSVCELNKFAAFIPLSHSSLNRQRYILKGSNFNDPPCILQQQETRAISRPFIYSNPNLGLILASWQFAIKAPCPSLPIAQTTHPCPPDHHSQQPGGLLTVPSITFSLIQLPASYCLQARTTRPIKLKILSFLLIKHVFLALHLFQLRLRHHPHSPPKSNEKALFSMLFQKSLASGPNSPPFTSHQATKRISTSDTNAPWPIAISQHSTVTIRRLPPFPPC